MFKPFFIPVDCVRIKGFYIEKDGLFRKRSLAFGIANRTLCVVAISIANSRCILMS